MYVLQEPDDYIEQQEQESHKPLCACCKELKWRKERQYLYSLKRHGKITATEMKARIPKKDFLYVAEPNHKIICSCCQQIEDKRHKNLANQKRHQERRRMMKGDEKYLIPSSGQQSERSQTYVMQEPQVFLSSKTQ